jgi:pyrroloquinoline-quinone synthase
MLSKQLKTIIDQYHLLKHAFYQAWNDGLLSKEVLSKYAVQYYAQVASFPRFLSRVHTHCPFIEVRKLILENLIDEELHGKDHPQLWAQFMSAFGKNKQDADNEILFSETEKMVDTYYDLADQNWQAGLCALYAYELQVPEIAESKIAGLKKFYGIDDESHLEFFTAHQVYDVKHAETVASLIDQYVDPAVAIKATEEAAKALWGFLDGMCRHAGISCETMTECLH